MALSYSPFYRGTPYSPADAQRAAALASGPAYPVAREPVVSLPPKAVVAPKEEVVDLNATPFASTVDKPYYGLTQETRQDYAEEVLQGIRDAGFDDPSTPFRIDMGAYQKKITDYLAGDTEELDKDLATSRQMDLKRTTGLTEDLGFGTSPSSIATESYKNLSNLKKESPEQFSKVFSSLTSKPQLSYLYKELEKGNISDKEYAESALASLKQENPSKPYFINNNKVYTYPTDDTRGTPYHVMLRPKEVWNMPAATSERSQEDYFLQNIGGLGKSSTDFRQSAGEFLLTNPATQLASALVPPFGAAVTAAKLATGVDVSPVEIATSMLTGLEMAGVIKPPAVGADIAPKGGVGPTLPTTIANEGVGLFGQGYETTKNIITAAAAGDAKGAAIALVGKPLIESGLSKVGLDKAAIENAGIQYDDFEAGLSKVVAEVAGGAELDEALAAGLGTYIKEGGTLGSIDLPETDLDLGIIEDVVRDVVRPIGTVATEVAKFVEKAIPEDVDKIEDAIRAVGSTTEDVVRTTGSAVDDAVIQPIREAGKVIDDEVIQPIGDAFSDLDTAIRDAMPDIDLPSVDLPSVDIPSFGLPSLEINYTAPAPSPTRTTDNLFRDELFQFQTEIEDTQERLEYIDLNDPDPFEASSLLQRYPF